LADEYLIISQKKSNRSPARLGCPGWGWGGDLRSGLATAKLSGLCYAFANGSAKLWLSCPDGLSLPRLWGNDIVGRDGERTAWPGLGSPAVWRSCVPGGGSSGHGWPWRAAPRAKHTGQNTLAKVVVAGADTDSLAGWLGV